MRAAIVAAIALVAGCAVAPVVHDVQRTARMPAAVDVAWQALVDVIAERNWPVAQLDRASGLAMVDWVRVPDHSADCGSAPLSSEGPIQARFSARIRARADGASEIEVNASFRRARSFGDAAGMIACTSLGSLEATVHEMVEDRLAQRR